MPETVPPADLVCIAAVATAHGVRGALRLRSFTEDPENVAAYGPVYDAKGRRLFRLTVIGRARGDVVVEAEGVGDRNRAEALRGVLLHVPRAALPEPEPDEFYHADLIGLRVEDRAGRAIGRLKAVLNYGAGDVIEIEADDGRVLDLPFTREVVPIVEPGRGRIVVEPPAEVIAGVTP
jgi:16S rRNA processing protein RimM